MNSLLRLWRNSRREKEIKAMDLEERVEELEVKADAMKRRREGCLRLQGYDSDRDLSRSVTYTRQLALSAGSGLRRAEPGYSDYGRSRSKGRWRTRHQRHTTSGWESRSSSKTRHKHSKWNIKR